MLTQGYVRQESGHSADPLRQATELGWRRDRETPQTQVGQDLQVSPGRHSPSSPGNKQCRQETSRFQTIIQLAAGTRSIVWHRTKVLKRRRGQSHSWGLAGQARAGGGGLTLSAASPTSSGSTSLPLSCHTPSRRTQSYFLGNSLSPFPGG